MHIRLATLLVFLFTFFSATQSGAAEVINEIVALVGKKSITSMDLANEADKLAKRKNIRKDKRDFNSQVLDVLISRAVVDLVADQESIRIAPERVKQALDREMQMRGIQKIEVLQELIARETGMSWEEYQQEIGRQMITQQVVQLRVSVPAPSQMQIKEWYNQNKARLGSKYLVSVIMVPYAEGNAQDELRVSKIMKEAAALAATDFEAAAGKYSTHSSKSRGGLLGWLRLDELAMADNALAAMVSRMKGGQISQVFVGKGAYFLVKVQSVREITLEEVHEQIRALLYGQSEQTAFAQWIIDERKRIAVKIFLKNYQEP